ncbi:tRNA 2-thiouridine(34) synthase MnmA, partial [Georgenia sp. 10Sc9-8]|nr:tRNA 2-thiouridine(34) synthase MnmA [Georgenia halotolerans]
HDGAYAYTVGQRKGLGLTRPAPDGRPRYVLEVRPETNQVVVGPSELLSVDRISGTDTVWLADDVCAEDGWTDVQVQVRAHGEPVPAQVRRDESGLVVRLGTPLRGIAPGQSLVVYAGSRVLGQATISDARRGAAQPT